ncbi:MAG: NAD-dependent epimerase/dehydratase family protein, partial [Hyphomonadaceae bacterium]
LRAAGFAIRAQYARTPGADPAIEWRRHDFTESLDCAALTEGCAGVVHLAASVAHVPTMERLNIEATRALAEAAAKAGARYFGHASSIVVYGSPRTRAVDETTPRLNPRAPMAGQYYAEPYMLEYARTKTLAEEALEALAAPMQIDLYRPAVVADAARLLEARDWSLPRKVLALYRRTQYIYAPDAAAAIAHLVKRGLEAPAPGAPEAYNICDEECGSFSAIARRARAVSGDPRWRVPFELPLLGDTLRYGTGLAPRHSLWRLKLSNAKLRATGFSLPTGVPAAVTLALKAG